MVRRLILIASLTLAPAALAQPAPAFHASGEVQSSESSAAFDAEQVRGPRVSITREGEDGGARWVGRLKDQVVDVREVRNGVRGANVALYLERVKDGFMIRGNLGDRTVSIKVPDDVRLRDQYRWTLKGEADTQSPPAAQFIFAVIAAVG